MSAARRWIERQRSEGWRSWKRMLYAHARLQLPWERREDAAPENPAAAMRSWWEASRHRFGGLAPEDVRAEILAAQKEDIDREIEASLGDYRVR